MGYGGAGVDYILVGIGVGAGGGIGAETGELDCFWDVVLEGALVAGGDAGYIVGEGSAVVGDALGAAGEGAGLTYYGDGVGLGVGE